MLNEPDRLTLTLDLPYLGWAQGVIALGESEARFGASDYHHHDALSELLTAVMSLTHDEPLAECWWDVEPGQYLWTFSMRGANVHIDLDYTHEDRFDRAYSLDKRVAARRVHQDKPVEVPAQQFSVEVPLRDLVVAVCAASEDVRTRYGEAGYRENWEFGDFQFPTHILRRLEEWLDSPEANLGR